MELKVSQVVDVIVQRREPDPKLRPLKGYNLLVNTANAGTSFLVAAAVAALFLKFTVACVFGAVGYCLYKLANRELTRLALPIRSTGSSMFGSSSSCSDANILRRVGVDPKESKWTSTALSIEGVPLWRNRIDTFTPTDAGPIQETEPNPLDHMVEAAARVLEFARQTQK